MAALEAIQVGADIRGVFFDVLGKLQFDGRPLRELLIEAIRYGERPFLRHPFSPLSCQ